MKPSRMASVLRHVQLAAITCLVAGAADGFFAARAARLAPFYGAVLGAGLLVPMALPLGVVQGLVIHDGGRVLDRLGALDRWRAATSCDREADRAPVIALHAWVASTVVSLALIVTALRLFILRVPNIKDPDLQQTILLMGVGGGCVGLLLFTAASVPLTKRAMAALDRRFGLPQPRWPLARYAIYVVAPAAALALPLLDYGEQLGVLTMPVELFVLVVAEGLVWRILAARPLSGTPRKAAAWALPALLAAATIAGAVMAGRWQGSVALAADGRAMRFAIEALRAVTDVDRDGISSLYGGNDCAPFDGKRSPIAHEIPRNQIDEDCDGADGDADALARPPTFYDNLSDRQRQHFNVLLVVIDSLRADHLHLYGYPKQTSPHFDELGKESWVFTQAYSQSSTTKLSIPSILTGRDPGTMRWIKGPEPDNSETTLAARLKGAGYDTTLVINQYVRAHIPGLQHSFEHVDVVPKGVDWKSGEYVISRAIGAIDRAQAERKPFFVTAHFDDVHHPYRAFEGRAAPPFPNDDPSRASYDRCIAAFDSLFRVLTAHLRNYGLWDDTVVIITADHGEEFMEHGGTIHSSSCYVESLHVPLIVHVPGFEPQRIESRVALLDIVPTLIELLGLPREPLGLDGQSLFFPVLDAGRVDAARPFFCSIFQLLAGRKNFFTRSMNDDHFKLVHEALSDRVELYDIAADPDEKHDIAGDHPEVVGDLQGKLKGSLEGNLWDVRSFK